MSVFIVVEWPVVLIKGKQTSADTDSQLLYYSQLARICLLAQALLVSHSKTLDLQLLASLD